MRPRSFIQVAEIWAPDRSGQRLELKSGSYGSLADFARVSASRTFARGQGLPGRVWETHKPVVLNHFRDGSGFLRADAAARAGLTAGVGFPIHVGTNLVAVCVLLCGDAHEGGGALEVWETEPATGQLGLVSGYYGAFDGFRRLSALMKFPPGVGLPGRVLERQEPLIVDDLCDTDSFIRAAAAVTFGFSSGVGIPLFDDDAVTSVLVLLSVKGTPLARVFEIWVPDAGDERLVLHSGAYRGAEAMRPASVGLSFRRGEGLPGLVWESGLPLALDELDSDDGVRAEAARRSELAMGIAIPILNGSRVSAVLLLMN